MSAGDETGADASFDRYARIVRRTLGVPVALVSIVEEARQVFPGASGLPEPYATQRETPLSHSFCQYVVADRRPLIVTDARDHDRLAGNLAIEELDVIAYAGWPLTDHDGRVIGSLCAIDNRPRRWTDYDIEGLADLAAACSVELAQRELRRQTGHELHLAEHLHQRSRVLLALSESLSTTRTLAEVADAVGQVGLEQLGCSRAGIWLRDGLERIQDDPTGETVEKLEYVPSTASDWAQAAEFAFLTADDANPVGRCFHSAEPLYFRDRSAQDVAFDDRHRATDSGQARAMIPLSLRAQRFGVLVLVWPHDLEGDEEHRTTIKAMATYTAQAVGRSLLLQERVEVSATLQTAMLTELPQPDGLELAARYRPARLREQVGGDWYDALVLPSGATAVIIGDVVGHDIQAAAVMGQLRNTLRAFVWAADDSPSVSVARLDHANAPLGLDAMASVLLARIEAGQRGSTRTVTWTSAGHLPALVVRPDGTTSWLDAAPDVLLGVTPDVVRSDHSAEIEPGSLLILYTDGLVERRGTPIVDGLDRLAESAARHRSAPVADLIDAVLHDLLGLDLADDVAVIAVRFSPA